MPALIRPGKRSNTPRLSAEQALRASEQRYRTLFTSMTEGFAFGEMVCDESGRPCDFRFLEMNEAFERHTGLRRELVAGRSMRQVLPKLEAHWVETYGRVALSGEPAQFESYNRDLDRHFSVYCYSPAHGQFAIVFTDVTENRRSEQARRRTEAQFRSVFEHAAIGMGRVNFADARWIDVNDSFCRMLGYSREEMLATPWPAMTHPEDVDPDLVSFRSMAAGELDSYTIEKRFVHKLGHHVWARLTLSLVRDGDGRPDYEIAVVENVTDRKTAEHRLQEANERLREADRRKTQFLAVLSHELRNPLAPIHNSLHILDHAAAGSPEARQAKEVIQRQARQLHRLVDDLLDVSRVTQGKIRLDREIVDLATLVRRGAEDHRPQFAQAGIAFEVRAGESPVFVDGDPARLAQVIGNLLANAAKFTPGGGRTTLSLESGGDGLAQIRVRDDGVGVDPALLDRLFDPFVQAESSLERNGGLGLGLAVLRGIVELHGGSVRAHSEGVGRGAEFTVTLPTVPVGRERRSAARARDAKGEPRRIVVIEDNRDTAESLKALLELYGHQVTVAHDGVAGVEAVRAALPDLVLCDIGLPGMNGFEVARALRSDPSLARTRLVAVSGYAQPRDVENARLAGFDRHLAKPVDPAKLAEL